MAIAETPPTPRARAADIRALLVDDHPAVRAGLLAMLEAAPGVEAVAATSTAREALGLAARLRPDVALLDYHLPDEDGLSLCLRLTTAARPVPAVIYTAFADDRLVLLAMIAGADAVVGKASPPCDLCAAMLAAAAGTSGRPALSPGAMQVAGSLLDPADLPVLGMLAHRTPPAEVARTLGVTGDWLTARRWAMLERLRGRPVRRKPPPRPREGAGG